MKRYIALTFVALLTLATSVLAQTSPIDLTADGDLSVKSPVAISAIITAFANRSHAEVVGIDQLKAAMTYQGVIEKDTPLAILVSRLVKPYGFETVLDDETIHIRRKATPQQTPTAKAPVDLIAAGYAPVQLPPPPAVRVATPNSTQPDLIAAGYAPVQLPPPVYGGYNGSGYGYDHEYVQRAIDLDTWGALKFKKGRERFMEHVEIWGCGKRLVQADEANNIFDKQVLVPVNCSPLTYRYSDGESDWEVEIAEMIVPLRLQKVREITLNQEFFARARKRTMNLHYDFVEQPDGSFKRVLRPESPTKK